MCLCSGTLPSLAVFCSRCCSSRMCFFQRWLMAAARYAQEYLAQFVDWAGVGFFARDKLLDNGQPVPYPALCDGVFAVIDTASKTGTEHDATAVTFFARTLAGGRFPLMILDWDTAKMGGAFRETWLPSVFARREDLARLCRARHGSLGAFIEDKNSGT